MNLNISCPDCGSEDIHYPEQAHEQVVCNACRSELGTKEAAERAVEEALQQAGDDFIEQNAPQGGPWTMTKK